MILFWSFFSNGDFTFFSIGVFTFFSFGVFSFFSFGVFSFFSIGLFTFFTGLGLFLLPSPSDVEDVDRGALRTKKDLRKMQKNIIQQLKCSIYIRGCQRCNFELQSALNSLNLKAQLVEHIG